MKRCIKFISALLLLVALGFMSNFKAEAASQVRVSLPSFPVTINSHTIDNVNREYPFIVYKDITYFPMTYHDSYFLGLVSNWTPQTGLNITLDQSQPYVSPYEYVEHFRKQKNTNAHTATIATLPIQINGQTINNKNEPYPILFFRNITYFPMTWKFGYEKFGWGYQFSRANGLQIETTPGYSTVLLNEQKFEAIKVGVTKIEDVEGIIKAPVHEVVYDLENASLAMGRYQTNPQHAFKFNFSVSPRDFSSPNRVVDSKMINYSLKSYASHAPIESNTVIQKLTNGISYEQAVKIIGAKGIAVEEDMKTIKYVWRYTTTKKTTMLVATFAKQNGKTMLTQKHVNPF